MIVNFKADHAISIIRTNMEYGYPLVIPMEEMISAYTSPGSVAQSIILSGVPAMCGGIMNQAWKRGEAWLLISAESKLSSIATFRLLKNCFPGLAKQGRFRRVQATCFDPAQQKLFELLGFHHEGNLTSFGPIGENADLYARIF